MNNKPHLIMFNILFINLYKDIERKEKENEEAQNNLYKKLIKS